MLIVANGVFKCGSTWQFQIANRLVTNKKEVPDEFRNTKWANPSFDPRRLREFLARGDHVDHNFVAKQHIVNPQLRTLLLNDPHVLVCTLTRDLRDVLVSAYHHDRREGLTDAEDIDRYYWNDGRKRIDRVVRDHRLWNVGHAQVFVGSYEGLHQNFSAQVRALASFLGVDVDDASIASIREATAFGSRPTGPGRFRRKGIVGDWRGTLSNEILEDIDKRVDGTL